MEPQSISMIQPRRLIDFLEDQNLPFPRRPKSKISVFIHAFSRRFSNKSSSSSRRCPAAEPTMSRTTSVTVKDILRWKSFRDVAEPISSIDNNNVPLPPSIIMSPNNYSDQCTSTSTMSNGSSPNSSWSDSSDFTVGDSPVWCRGLNSSDVVVTDNCKKHNFNVNVGYAEKAHNNITKLADPKDRIVHEEEEEEEQFSPISVLDFTLQHEETFSSFHQSLVNMQRRNIMPKQRIQDFENLIGDEEDHCLVNEFNDDIESFQIEEKAIHLMDHVFKTTTISIKEWDDTNMEYMLLDFFRDEMITSKEAKINNGEIESKILRMAKSWVKGEDHDGSLEWGLEGTREVCIRGMEKNENWKHFEEEQRDIAIEIEKIMLNDLLDELSIDLLEHLEHVRN